MPTPTSDSPSLPPPEGAARPVAASGGEDGPFPVPSPHAASEGLSELPVADPAPALCGFEHDQWDIVRMRRRCIAPAGHTTGQFAYDHGPWQGVPNAPSTPPAARESAPQRPEVAGEPESASRRPPGREAPLDRTRRYLVPVARLDLPSHPDDTHLSVYQWLSQCDAWATGPAICGYSTSQGALPDGTTVTCTSCLEYQPEYERYLQQLGVGRETWQAEAEAMGRDRDRLAGDKTALQRAVRLLMRSDREQTQRAEAAEATTRASRYVADFWRSALSGQGNAAAAHALAMVGAALNGERDPNELGLDADEHAAFRAAIAEESTP